MIKSVYHLELDSKAVKGAKFAFLPGDPDRVPEIARSFDKEAMELAYKREFRTWMGKIEGRNVVVTSTGIGGPSTSIAIEELAQLGVRTFIRIGTTGAIQKKIELGHIIITTASARLDASSTHYAPVEYPAVASYEVVHALVESAKASRIQYHLGITASSDTFYPGQERYDSFSRYVIKRFQGTLKEWQKLNVLNYEMESATLLTICSVLGLKAGCVTGVIVNRAKEEKIDSRVVKKAESNAIRVAIAAMKRLI